MVRSASALRRALIPITGRASPVRPTHADTAQSDAETWTLGEGRDKPGVREDRNHKETTVEEEEKEESKWARKKRLKEDRKVTAR